MQKCTITLLFSFLLLLGCQAPNTQQEIRFFGNFYVRYLEDGQEIKSEVTLFQGDSMPNAQPFEPIGGIQFMGSAMQSRNFNDQLVRYQYEYRMATPQEYRFKFNAPDGHAIDIVSPVQKIDHFTIDSPLSIQNGGALTITPDQFTENQQVLILLSNEEGLAKSIQLNGPFQANKFPIPQKHLKDLSPGNWEYYAVKKSYSRPIEGIQLLTEFYTQPQTLTITK